MIGNRRISEDAPTFVIAEMSANHLMDFDRAVAIMQAAKDAGADAIKIQTYTPDTITLDCDDPCFQITQGTIWDGTTLHKLYETAYTPWEWQPKLKKIAEEMGLIKQGEIVVLTAGVPLGISGTTNMIKVHVAGHILMRGKGLNDKVDSGNMCVVNSAEELKEKFKVGDIIVAKDTCNEMMEQIRLSSGLILEKNSINCHGAIAGLSLDIPVLIGAENATQILKSGAFVTLDGKKGIVSCNN